VVGKGCRASCFIWCAGASAARLPPAVALAPPSHEEPSPVWFASWPCLAHVLRNRAIRRFLPRSRPAITGQRSGGGRDLPSPAQRSGCHGQRESAKNGRVSLLWSARDDGLRGSPSRRFCEHVLVANPETYGICPFANSLCSKPGRRASVLNIRRASVPANAQPMGRRCWRRLLRGYAIAGPGARKNNLAACVRPSG
jgi:hypothetical protein